jgi:hypothetical protein
VAPIVGLSASGARIQAGSTFAGIGDTVAIGRVLYDSGFPVVPVDNLWVPARENPARFTVIPIGDIHIFIGETNPTSATETNFQRIGIAETPIRTVFEQDTEEESSDLELSKLPRSDLKTNCTQPALEVEEVVDGCYGSAMSNLALETPRYALLLSQEPLQDLPTMEMTALVNPSYRHLTKVVNRMTGIAKAMTLITMMHP